MEVGVRYEKENYNDINNNFYNKFMFNFRDILI